MTNGNVRRAVIASSDLARLLMTLCEDAGASGSHDAAQVVAQPHESTTLLAVTMMLATGLRVEEVVCVRCRDVDVDARYLRVTGKGRRERQVYLTNAWLTELTRSYIAAREDMEIDHDRLFFNRRGDALTAAAMRSRLLVAARDAQIAARVTPHMLRHTAATRLVEAGVNIRLIQRLLGHASLSTTEIYTHVSERALQSVLTDVDVLGRLLHG